MEAGKILILLLGAGLLLVHDQEISIFRRPSISPAAQPGVRAGQVFRDQMKNGTNGPEMVVIPPGRFHMGDIQGIGPTMSSRCTR